MSKACRNVDRVRVYLLVKLHIPLCLILQSQDWDNALIYADHTTKKIFQNLLLVQL